MAGPVITFDGEVWRLPAEGLCFRLTGTPGSCSLAVADLAAEGLPFLDHVGRFPVRVAGTIPVIWWDGAGTLEHELAEITGVRHDASATPLTDVEAEWLFAKAVYAARDLTLCSDSFTAALAALAPPP